jgi:hypothetical protein
MLAVVLAGISGVTPASVTLLRKGESQGTFGDYNIGNRGLCSPRRVYIALHRDDTGARHF